jgi:hypothetical protein
VSSSLFIQKNVNVSVYDHLSLHDTDCTFHTEARRDLFSSIQVDNLEGSVTRYVAVASSSILLLISYDRVRFARLSRIRTILGCPPEEDDIPADAHKFVEDNEYLALDLSIHWVGHCGPNLQTSVLISFSTGLHRTHFGILPRNQGQRCESKQRHYKTS